MTEPAATPPDREPSASTPLVARHVRQILFWPLQLMPTPAGEVGVERHWENLDQCAGPNPWAELEDEFTADPAEFQERHYREFTTFLPLVQRFLYGQGRSSASRVGYGESPIRIFRRSDVAACRMTYADGAQVRFEVRHVDLYFFFDIDIVVLVLELFADDLPLERVHETLYRFGRAFPTGWDADGHANACMRRVEWIDAAGVTLADSDMDDRAGFLAFTGRHRATRIGAHWTHLLRPMVQHHSDEPGPVRYRQIEYHRMPKLTFLSFDDPFALTDRDFVRLAVASGSGERDLPYSDETVQHIVTESFYDRFWNPVRRDRRASTRLTCTGHAMTMVGQAGSPLFDDIETGLLGQFRHQYFLVALIAHFHKAALLMLSDRLITAVSRLDPNDVESQRRFRDQIRRTRAVFLRFNHRYWFHEVSNQSMAKDLFEMWSRHLGNDALFDEVREEVLDMGQYLDSDDTRRQGEAVLRLTVVTILGLIGTIATGFLGMNLIAEAEQPLSVKIAFFVMTLLPTIVLTLVTVRYSHALSALLDALGDETAGPLSARLRTMRRIVAGRRASARGRAPD